jgi:ABC-type amino acid transport substrate-binding protein
LTRPPLSPRLAVTAAALLALVLIPRSAQAATRTPARRAPCNAADPLHPAGSLRPAGPPSVTPGSLMATIRARGYLIAGVDLTLFHLSYQNPLDGQLEGFNIDMLHAISRAIFGSPDRIRFVSLQQGLALSARHPEFARFVNAVLAAWRASGGWAASYARWIGAPVPAPPALRYAD